MKTFPQCNDDRTTRRITPMKNARSMTWRNALAALNLEGEGEKADRLVGQLTSKLRSHRNYKEALGVFRERTWAGAPLSL